MHQPIVHCEIVLLHYQSKFGREWYTNQQTIWICVNWSVGQVLKCYEVLAILYPPPKKIPL